MRSRTQHESPSLLCTLVGFATRICSRGVPPPEGSLAVDVRYCCPKRSPPSLRAETTVPLVCAGNLRDGSGNIVYPKPSSKVGQNTTRQETRLSFSKSVSSSRTHLKLASGVDLRFGYAPLLLKLGSLHRVVPLESAGSVHTLNEGCCLG